MKMGQGFGNNLQNCHEYIKASSLAFKAYVESFYMHLWTQHTKIMFLFFRIFHCFSIWLRESAGSTERIWIHWIYLQADSFEWQWIFFVYEINNSTMPSLSGFALIIQLLDILTITTTTVAMKLPNRNFICSPYQNDTNDSMNVLPMPPNIFYILCTSSKMTPADNQ